MDLLNLQAKQYKKAARNLRLIVSQLIVFYKLLGIAKLMFGILLNQTGNITKNIMRRMCEESAPTQDTLHADMNFILDTRLQLQEWITGFQLMITRVKEAAERAKAAKREIELRLEEIEEAKNNMQ